MSEAEAAVEQTTEAAEAEMPPAEEAPKEETPKEGAEEKKEDGAEEKKEDGGETKAEEPSKGLSGTVAKHYNDLKEGTQQDRFKSRIFYQRNFNNWIKSMLIANTLKTVHRKKGCTVLDLCCGKGGDLLKWAKGDVKKLVCADIASVSVTQCQKRYSDMRSRSRRSGQKCFEAEFITADCAKTILADRYRQKDIQFDLCSCQFSFHYAFESAARVRTMLRNACERLRPGGYFIGTIPNAYEIVSRLKESEDLSFGNNVYKVTFTSKDEFPLFGCKYNFHLEGVVDCPEFLIYFPLLQEMAKEFDMELVFFKKFEEVFNENYQDPENQALITKMQALEQYPPERQSSSAIVTDDYAHAEARHKELESQNAEVTADGEEEKKEEGDGETKTEGEGEKKTEGEGEKTEGDSEGEKKPEGEGEGEKKPEGEEKKPEAEKKPKVEKKPTSIGTLSKSEWEAASLYCAFAFKKAGEFVEELEEEPPKKEEKPSKVTNGDAAAPAEEAAPEAGGEEAAEGEGAAAEEQGNGEEEPME